MARPNQPAPKLHATKTQPAELSKGAKHEEAQIDEAEDESFPASDPPSHSNPGSSLAVKHAGQEGRKTPEPDTNKGAKKTR